MPRKRTDNLFLHSSGQYAKRIGNRVHYFGRDEKEAHDRWLNEKAYLIAGRRPPQRGGESAGIVELANVYHAEMQRRLGLAKGGVKQRHVTLVHATIRRFIDLVGEECRPDDLTPLEWVQIAERLFEPVPRKNPVRGDVLGRQVKRRSVATVDGDIRRIKAFLQWCADAELCKPLRWKLFKTGSDETPADRAAQAAEKFTGFTKQEVRSLIESATVQFRPILLLALNAGVGGFDISEIKLDNRPKGNWFDLPRLKTGTNRRIYLWDETLDAIRRYIVWRGKAQKREDSDKLFLTKTGRAWIETSESGTKDSIGTTFRKLRINAGIRTGSFYDLRRQFQSKASDSLDFPAVRQVMGHAKRSRDMSDRYTVQVSDERIKAVCLYVRDWVYND
jgi:integrase